MTDLDPTDQPTVGTPGAAEGPVPAGATDVPAEPEDVRDAPTERRARTRKPAGTPDAGPTQPGTARTRRRPIVTDPFRPSGATDADVASAPDVASAAAPRGEADAEAPDEAAPEGVLKLPEPPAPRRRERARDETDDDREGGEAAPVDDAAPADDDEAPRASRSRRGSRGGSRRRGRRGSDSPGGEDQVVGRDDDPAGAGAAQTVDAEDRGIAAGGDGGAGELDGGAGADAPLRAGADVDPDADADAATEDDALDSDDDDVRSTRGRRRRGRRRGGRRGRSGAGEPEDSDADDADVEADGDDDAVAIADVDDAERTDTATGTGARKAPPTRLSARDRDRGRGRGGRRPVTGLSDDTRRAIAAGPPRRMLVTVGTSRTQIAVLEERNLVEHYVTRRADDSYVGNIYKGRVQNVLPGMEAAFVDIGKGRNGVLYAGEVDYDEADVEDSGSLPRIEETLKQGQGLLVQVTKDPMGTKGARLTQNLSIAGRYCVLAPGDDMLGISRKLPDDERERLRKILKAIKPEGFGLIVRTAAEGATREQLEADVERLVARWSVVGDRADAAKVLEPVYEEPELVIRVIRDVFGPEHEQLLIDDADLAERVREYLRDVAPDLVDKVVHYRGDDPLFDAYEVTTQIRRALEKKVWLKSGGYLIIEKTEAMWVIDVNTGKFVGKDNLEETVLRNNLEAADEIARQLRLRDMGGIIVIDFVDMIVPANRDEVLKRFKRELARDKTKSRVMEISRLGLVQMTRKNVSHGLQQSFTTECDTCEGRGRVIVDDLLA